METRPRPRHPLLLIVLDGWGIAPESPDNAILLSGAPNMRRLSAEFPSTRLEASGEAVGLPPGQMGNSEVGHLNIGAGRIVDQDFVRITKRVRAGTLGDVPALRELFDYAKTSNHPLHVLGLLGPGGVHSHEEHLFGVLDAADRAKVPRVWVHHVLDGRDTPPKSALDFARRAQSHVDKHANARVATVSGRYWTMDRDKRWERTERSHRMLTRLEGHRAANALDAIEKAYARGETDEFVEPTIVQGGAPIAPGDALLVYNFRPDRVRQIVRSIADPKFREFERGVHDVRVVSMTLYDRTFDTLGVRIAFPPVHPKMTLGEHYARLGLKQLRIAETEKYAHVTYFFSGGREDPFEGEERLLIPSPKVATYDLRPAMSAREITDALVPRLKEGAYDLVVLNFANADMVGHTGKLPETTEACRVVDECIGRLVEAAKDRDHLVAITADHGNAESMVDENGSPRTAHTTHPVPLILVHPSLEGLRIQTGGLANVAPTLLALLGLPIPPDMTATPLASPRAVLK